MMFANRLDAGRQLGTSLVTYAFHSPVVIGISRGGVPVAAEIAHVLHAPLDICVVRKVFSPGSPAFAIGAVAEGGGVYLDHAEIAHLRLTPAQVEAALALERGEAARLGQLLRDEPPQDLRGREAILVDDGVTSIDTLRAAVRALRAQAPMSVTLAVPAGSTELLEHVRDEFDRVVCLQRETGLVALGARYRDFSPVSESEVVAALAVAGRDAQRRAS